MGKKDMEKEDIAVKEVTKDIVGREDLADMEVKDSKEVMEGVANHVDQ
jgi:hypothetical protein